MQWWKDQQHNHLELVLVSHVEWVSLPVNQFRPKLKKNILKKKQKKLKKSPPLSIYYPLLSNVT